MKKLVTVAVAAALMLSAGTSLAQDARDAGIFADPAGTQSTMQAVAFTPFFFYAVAFDLDGQVKGFEFAASLPAGLTLLGTTYNGALNFGDVPGEFIVGTGGCLEGAGAFQMASFNGGYFVPTVENDIAVCIGGSNPTSFAGGEPGYLQCDGTLVPFGVAQNGEGRYPNGCLIINPTDAGPVAVEAASFGEMKARF